MALTWLTASQLDDDILRRVDCGKPFSMLRFGDGEYEVAKFVTGVSRNDIKFTDKFRRWFGKDFVSGMKHSEMVGLGTLILNAFKNCDMLGIPSFKEAYGYPKWVGIDPFVNKHFCQRKTLFYFYDIFTVWRKYSTFQHLLGTRTNIDLITCRPRLKKKILKRYLQLQRVGMEVIQPEFFMWKGHDAGLQKFVSGWNGKPHYPDRYNEICESLKSQAPLKGRLFFVGAGGLGKIYCDVVKQCGGMALDVGAMLDGWDSLTTRPYLQNIKEFAL